MCTCTPQLVCRVSELTGKSFFTNPHIAHMLMPCVSAVICPGTRYHLVQEILIASLKVLLNMMLQAFFS